MNVLMWFKRDLRVADHPALARAAEMGRVLPVYIAEPDYWALPDTSARQWAFTAECLVDLSDALAALGAPLVLRSGDAVAVLDGLCRRHNITHIVSHDEVGNLWSRARNLRVAAWARRSGIAWIEVAQSGVAQPQAGIAGLSSVPGVEPGTIPSARALRMADDPCPHRQAGGRARALLTLESFLATRGAPYRTAMASPLAAERACSRLSPYLALGALSLREVTQATAARQAERPGAGWAGSLRAFQGSLTCRGVSLRKSESTPEIEVRAQHPAVDFPRHGDAARLATWEAGETGVPFLDACLRYLRATGWLNFHARQMLASVASHHLGLDWRDSGTTLARRFTDYEPGIHWPQMQLHSGFSDADTPRICNPVKRGQERDPTGAFTRRWVPELAEVPDAFLQQPWKWQGAPRLLGRRYPEPIIDAVAATRNARASRGTAAAALAPHRQARLAETAPAASARPAPARHRNRAAQGQLCLDL